MCKHSDEDFNRVGNRDWDSLLDFENLKYLYRLWIIQEVALAKSSLSVNRGFDSKTNPTTNKNK